ncbi:MAG: zincin-like metallopeptidase domain-containing protein [Bryobacteraceae bacterium]
MIAELGSAFLAAELQLETEPRIDNAPYIENWLKVRDVPPPAVGNRKDFLRDQQS